MFPSSSNNRNGFVSTVLDAQGFVVQDVSTICSCIPNLSKAAKQIETSNITIEEFVIQLMVSELFSDAILFLSHALCRQDAITWALECVCESCEIKEKQDVAAIESVRRWLTHPNKTNQQFAQQASEAIGYRTPSAWLAHAVYLGEDVISLPYKELPYLDIPSTLFGHAVAGAVLLVGHKSSIGAIQSYKQFIEKIISRLRNHR